MNKHPIVFRIIASRALGAVPWSHADEAVKADTPTKGIDADAPPLLWNRPHACPPDATPLSKAF